jgi:hypothetical protein
MNPITSSTKDRSIAVAEFPGSSSTMNFILPKSAPKSSKGTSAPMSAAVRTEIIAQVDVGFGNTISIRGMGAGLSWDKGQPMAWTGDAWHWNTNSKENFEFKVLINDQTWMPGENLHAKAGSKVVFKPAF